MYAQLFYESEEGNFYPQTDRLHIDDSLTDLLTISEEHEGNNAFWQYYEQNEMQAAISGGWHITDNNRPC